MTDEEYVIQEYDNSEPPPWFHTPLEKQAGRIVQVEATDHDQYGAGFRFHFYITGDEAGETIWYGTGVTKTARNKLGKMGIAIYGDLDSIPADVRAFEGEGISIVFEHQAPATADDRWSERVIGITKRKLSKGEEAEDVTLLQQQDLTTPF